MQTLSKEVFELLKDFWSKSVTNKLKGNQYVHGVHGARFSGKQRKMEK